MPEFAEREQYEFQFMHDFADVGAQALDKLLRVIGDPPDLANIPPSYWASIEIELGRRYNPLLKEIYLRGAGDVVEELGGPAKTSGIIQIPTGGGIDIAWDLINSAAAEWARNYTFDAVRGINNTTRRLLRGQVSSFSEQGLTIVELGDLLAPTFGPGRGSAIGATETTRASVQGELGLVAVVEAEGIEMVDIFATSNDAIVCPICGPLNGKIVPRELAPPLHVRCRCWLNHMIAELARARGIARLDVRL